MSSGNAAYRITLARELARRRLLAAQARYQRTLAQLQRLEHRIERMDRVFDDIGVRAPAATWLRAGAAAEDYDAAALATEEAIQATRRHHEAAVAAARARMLVTPMFAPRREELEPSAIPVVPSVSVPSAVPAPAREAVERVLARLPGAADPTETQRAAVAAEAALGAADEASFRRALDRLRMTVQAADDRHRALEARVVQLDDLRARLDGLDGPQVGEARRRLDDADPREALPDDLAFAVGSAAAHARAEQDRSFALDAVAEVLDELGYEVGEGFATAVAEGGAVVPLPRSRRHSLQVTEHEGQLRFEVVRHADALTSAGADKAAERSWCDDNERFRHEVAERGVELEFGALDEPGLQRLRQVERRHARRSRRDDHAARSRDRRPL